ncbi:MAG: helix-turn-helix domain-containing protein [Patescibacteria group bacterium]
MFDDQFSSAYNIGVNRNIMIDNLLKSFRLTNKETKIFLKVLELGSQPASNIARVCEMPRNTVRSILDGLVKKGLMVKTRRANTQYYATEKKENLIRSLKHKKVRAEEEIDNQIKLLEAYGDELSTRHWAKSRPRITFYEGTAGLEKVYEDTLTAKNGLKSWASYDDMLDSMPEYFETYFKRRAKKKIPMRSIHPDTPAAREGQARDMQELRDSALVPVDKFNWSPEIQVYNDKINITSWKEKLGIIIESEEIADALRTIFDMSYEAAASYGKVGGIKNYDELINE